MRSLRRPPALRRGDRVAVLTISSPVPEARLASGLPALREAGLEPVVYPSARASGTLRPYLAGDDALRVADLTAALTDPSIAGVFFARGGSGAQRTLAGVDWSALVDCPPKVLVGFSDVTAVLEAVAAQLGWASVHSGTMVAADEPASRDCVDSLLRMVMSPDDVTTLSFPEAETIGPGRSRGVTVGGNLCVLTASLGTATSRPAIGGILLLEDVTEDDYRIDRMLTHLHRAGYLDGVAGIITGSFTDCGPPETVAAILTERLAGLGVPMISGVDIGHGAANRAFPLGIAAELDADARTLRLLDPPLIASAGDR
jgi:muramoyltetrapeptide carboxypeptidase